MTDELIGKLNIALQDPIEKENQVVFIMSKIRKLLERENLDKEFPILKRYTDWALHAEIKDVRPIKEIIEKIEATIINEEYDTEEPFQLIDFVAFRDQAIEFFSSFNIKNYFSENEYWRNFRTLLIETLKDCPLKPKEGEIIELIFKESTIDLIIIDIKMKDRTIRFNCTMENC